MQTIRYSPAKVAMFTAGLILMAAGGYWMTENFYGRGAFAGWLFLAVAAVGIPIQLRYLVDPRILAFDHRHLTSFGLFGERSIAWEDLADIHVESYGNWLGEVRHLKLIGPFGSLRAPRVSEKMLPAGMSLEVLVELMEIVQAEGPPPIAMRQPAAPVTAAPIEPPRSAGFGRKGL